MMTKKVMSKIITKKITKKVLQNKNNNDKMK